MTFLEDNFPFQNIFSSFKNKVNVSWDTISVEQPKEDTHSISHSSYELPPPVTTLSTTTQLLQTISSASDGVPPQSGNISSQISTSTPSPTTQVSQKQTTFAFSTSQTLPSRPLITYRRREKPPIPSQTPHPPHNPSAPAQNQPQMAFPPPQPIAPPTQPDTPTQSRPTQPATKVHPLTTCSQTNSLKTCQFLTTTTPSPKIPTTYKQAKLTPQ